MTDSVQISKTLSFWLRHRPDAAGLTVDGSGWASVDEVLGALGREQLDVDWSRLVEVVELSDKQRFELSADGGRIRARQGHSIAVEGDWSRADPPAELYHGTAERFLGAILSEGLKPMRRHHVHLSPDPETAHRVGSRRGPSVVLVVEAERLAEQGAEFLVTGNGVWLTSHVPPEFIRWP